MSSRQRQGRVCSAEARATAEEDVVSFYERSSNNYSTAQTAWYGVLHIQSAEVRSEVHAYRRTAGKRASGVLA